MAEKIYRLSDDAIVYLRDILTLGIVTKTDIVSHLRQMKLTTELRGEVEYLVPSEGYKTEYAVVAEHLLKVLETMSEDGDTDLSESEAN